MTAAIRRWRMARRYRATLRELQRLSAGELARHGILPAEFHYLALAVSGL